MTAPRETAGALERFVASMGHAVLCPRSNGYEKVKSCICELGRVEAELAALRSSQDRAGAMEKAIRAHRDQRGDDRCWMDDRVLYGILGESEPEHVGQLDDPETMLANCKRFIASRHDPSKPYTSPQRTIATLESEHARLRSLVESAYREGYVQGQSDAAEDLDDSGLAFGMSAAKAASEVQGG